MPARLTIGSRIVVWLAEILSGRPEAMQLRYLSTLNVIAAEKNSTIVFPFPMELVQLIPGMTGAGATKPKPPETT